jgi:hypothetical protein
LSDELTAEMISTTRELKEEEIIMSLLKENTLSVLKKDSTRMRLLSEVKNVFKSNSLSSAPQFDFGEKSDDSKSEKRKKEKMILKREESMSSKSVEKEESANQDAMNEMIILMKNLHLSIKIIALQNDRCNQIFFFNNLSDSDSALQRQYQSSALNEDFRSKEEYRNERSRYRD